MFLSGCSGNTAHFWPDKRRKGTGRFLLREILRLAHGLPGVKEVVLSVAQSEEPTIRLYTRVGFRTNSEDQGSLDLVLDVGGEACNAAGDGVERLSLRS